MARGVLRSGVTDADGDDRPRRPPTTLPASRAACGSGVCTPLLGHNDPARSGMAEDEALRWSSSPVGIILVAAPFGGFFVWGLLASHNPVGEVFSAGLLAGLLYFC